MLEELKLIGHQDPKHHHPYLLDLRRQLILQYFSRLD
jgi:hypothetical protein